MLDGFVPPLLVTAAAVGLLGLRRLLAGRGTHRTVGIDIAIAVAIVCFSGALEIVMGRPAAYRNGPVRLWSGDVTSDQNSQQIADPYSFTHVIHGAAFYGLTRLAFPAAPLALRAVTAITLESAWEVYENTDTVINRYRAATVSLGYVGDSVTNSIGDILSCAIGFALAWWFPTRVTIAWVAAIEVVLAFLIRDNLTLNILMLIYPIDAIKAWQMGA